MVRIHPGDKQIDLAVVVVVRRRSSNGISNAREPGLRGDVFEFHSAQISKQVVVKFRGALHQGGNTGAVGEENIVQPVAIVIKNRDASRHGFDEPFFGCGSVLEHEVQTCGGSDVTELDRSRRRGTLR